MLLINRTCLVVSSLELQRRLIQVKVHKKIFHSVSKETTHKPSKVAAAKNVSSCVHVIDSIIFLISFDNWKLLFFANVFSYLVIFSATKFETSILKEVCILRYLKNISANSKVSE